MSGPAYWPGIAAAHPVPGDADSIARLADGLRRLASDLSLVAGRIESAHQALDALAWDGTAAAAFRRSQQRLPPRLRRTAMAYARAADVLADYAFSGRGLAQSQKQAWEAELRAQRARAAYESAVEQSQTLSIRMPQPTASDAPPDLARWQHIEALAEQQRQSMNVITEAQQECRELHNGVRVSAQLAAVALARAMPEVEHARHASWISRTGIAALHHISRAASIISTVTAVLAILTIWCPALSGPLATVSVITGAVALLCDVALSFTPGGPSGRQLATEALLVGLGGAGKASRLLIDARMVRPGERLLRDGRTIVPGRAISRSYVPTLDRAFGKAGVAPRVLVRTYPTKNLPKQRIGRGATEVIQGARSELPILVKPQLIRRAVLRDLARVRQKPTPEMRVYPAAHYRTWAVSDTVASVASLKQGADLAIAGVQPGQEVRAKHADDRGKSVALRP